MSSGSVSFGLAKMLGTWVAIWLLTRLIVMRWRRHQAIAATNTTKAMAAVMEPATSSIRSGKPLRGSTRETGAGVGSSPLIDAGPGVVGAPGVDVAGTGVAGAPGVLACGSLCRSPGVLGADEAGAGVAGVLGADEAGAGVAGAPGT